GGTTGGGGGTFGRAPMGAFTAGVGRATGLSLAAGDFLGAAFFFGPVFFVFFAVTFLTDLGFADGLFFAKRPGVATLRFAGAAFFTAFFMIPRLRSERKWPHQSRSPTRMRPFERNPAALGSFHDESGGFWTIFSPFLNLKSS